jgi:hypothetical protein
MDTVPDAVAAADSVLISGPPMSGKYDLCIRLLARWADAPILVSTGRTAETVRSDYERLTGQPANDLVVIDCQSSQQGTGGDDTERTKYVKNPGDLTAIGVKFTDVVESSKGVDHAVGVYSLSELLQYWDPDRVYQFTRVVASQTSGQGWPFVGVVGSTAHDEQVVHTLYEPFETVIETRVNDEREFRVRDRLGEPSPWTPL